MIKASFDPGYIDHRESRRIVVAAVVAVVSLSIVSSAFSSRQASRTREDSPDE